ncbi:DNA-3-methyladenine glycosylase I [uncultured Ruminobacter sp.]|uniref:DNA-3-methyladenine glycosylase I n=1 Tax=uncultured Ruminobacter sp. TaxID=538947 RepID=UPI0025DC7E98|nr:DNA-3-methyladenine glycosylase I [uncultured Ruminobacter sp.]
MSYCGWKDSSDENLKYHDSEWGIPVSDDVRHFECLMLEALQCGLSWNIIIRKRDVIRKCFADFDFRKVAGFGEDDVERIMNTAGMIRSRRKIEAVISNAGVFAGISDEFGSFRNYIRSFTGTDAVILYDGHQKGLIPASNGLSARISRDLRKRGLKYAGPVTVYAYLQAVGIICDHDADCPCFRRITSEFQTISKKCDDEKEVKDFR